MFGIFKEEYEADNFSTEDILVRDSEGNFLIFDTMESAIDYKKKNLKNISEYGYGLKYTIEELMSKGE